MVGSVKKWASLIKRFRQAFKLILAPSSSIVGDTLIVTSKMNAPSKSRSRSCRSRAGPQ